VVPTESGPKSRVDDRNRQEVPRDEPLDPREAVQQDGRCVFSSDGAREAAIHVAAGKQEEEQRFTEVDYSDYTPEEDHKGWNDFSIIVYDVNGNRLKRSFTVLFGNTLPDLEIIKQPEDTIFTTSTGNDIIFSATTTLGVVDSVIVSYDGNETIYTGQSGNIFFNIDTLGAGDYTLTIEVINSLGNSALATIEFTIADTTTTVASRVNASEPAFYPNPAGNMLYFRERGDYKVYSLQGIRRVERKDTDFLEISMLEPGLYILRSRNRTWKFRKE